ncbi:adhesion G-protein coupled receptor G5-like [Acipenser ruthenus]|uniref:adhesion G-protein coupled receptor G5-like n=1 Tax=Acipenser ruthenus TaxID=7906 RepID=UPI00145AFD9C|nr:adhesion G-protein coupled receptor G5-like [Acipenser ruthenus]XP_033899168.1 adhesion G-protein coupled receptor G5-like [Acipenser ruthenus]
MCSVTLGRICTFLLFACFLNDGRCERAFRFCGVRKHSNETQKLQLNVTRGCSDLSISSNADTLFIGGELTISCVNTSSISLPQGSGLETSFCVYWDGFLDLLRLEYNTTRNFTLCGPSTPQTTCCTDLSLNNNSGSKDVGIFKGSVRGDIIEENAQEFYIFRGESNRCDVAVCKDLLNTSNGQTAMKSGRGDELERLLMQSKFTRDMQDFELPCGIQAAVFKLGPDFKGNTVVRREGRFPGINKPPSVYIPPTLLGNKTRARKTPKIICLFHNNNSLFQDKNSVILNGDVVGVTVENEVIADLVEPVIFTFFHKKQPENMTRTCVFWDGLPHEGKMFWNESGCKTLKSDTQTACHCDHLTYFAVLLQISNKPVHNLEAQTNITYIGCGISALCCVLTIGLFLCQRKCTSDKSSLIHMNLAVALLLLNVSFLLNMTLASLCNEGVCLLLALMLHYSLLCSFTWMGIEAYNVYRLLCQVFRTYTSLYMLKLCLVGFVLPAAFVCGFASRGAYGLYRITSSTGTETTMCWILHPLVHYIANVGYFVVIFLFGISMLVVTVVRIRHTEKHKCTPERSSWKLVSSVLMLTCLFGTTWGLNFFSFTFTGQLLSTILNSLQGFCLCVRYFLMRPKQGTSGSRLSKFWLGSLRNTSSSNAAESKSLNS